ncbi:purine-nucleoside phosphorylase, partial [Candidatus Poribacteria bacterium]|nr:purine-nucleoside phosphorylase [Candidatus Poribacteria bacterium]
MLELERQINSAVEHIRNKSQLVPEIAVILGTGLGALAQQVKEAIEIPYEEIPNFPTSTLETHAGNLVLGSIEGKNVVVMQGRF